MSKLQIDVRRAAGLSIHLRISKPIPGDDPELVRVTEVDVPIVQALIVAAGIVSESIPGINHVFTAIARNAKKEAALEPPPVLGGAEEPAAAKEAPAT
jgi:hypothetical protein